MTLDYCYFDFEQFVFPFPSLKFSAAEFIQYRRPVGLGPSSKTWPRWAPHRLHRTSVLIVNKLLSGSFLMFFPETGVQKLGQPVPELNFVSELNKSLPQHMHLYMPFFFKSQYSPEKGSSVPFKRVTRYCSAVSSFFHCLLVFMTLSNWPRLQVVLPCFL